MNTDKSYFVHPTAFIEDDVKIGDGTKIWHQVQVRKGAAIGKNCIFGKSVFIDFEVTIGDNVKIQNFVSVYHGVTLEDDVFVGPHVCFTNDLLPRAANPDWELVPTLVKKGASIGANATVVCGITIGEYSMIGAGSLVSKDVPAHGLVFGNPARLKGYVCYCGNILKRSNEPLPYFITLTCEKCNKQITT
ncbi:MAG: dTDP-3-amino-3,6-dideoxy-alpha-D-galactopyranose 3-N-acetyltransferase [Candidatus Heimdallarchaeota archaeon AB_125]|nr:MAG: dTDP-3-amino-3,6-dideoxy-alpha-D-galactopyranose 3-N-acetyltransferase [Candidatus Heimdallarchaeota archaeon AB_125]